MTNKKTKQEITSPQPAFPDNVNGVRITREYIESLVVALVLAFFFKAFAAEAYLIPTGSMASTLMGRHKDVRCEMCGYQYQINASEESDDQNPTRFVDYDGSPIPPPQVVGGACPHCRYTMYLGTDNIHNKNYNSYNGDRIFVNKSQFDFNIPRRWRVTVFRYPGKPQINYIKRLIGLENETIRIEHGDIFVKHNDENNFEIQRKPLPQLLAMLRIVDDNDYVIPELHDIGWFDKWNNKSSSGKWKRSDDFKSFSIDTTDEINSNSSNSTQSNPLDNTNADNNNNTAEHWLEFSNIVPTSDDWFALKQQRLPQISRMDTNPQLVTDFIGYNSGIVKQPDKYGVIRLEPEITLSTITRNGESHKEHFCRQNTNGMGLNWVGDLATSVNLNVQKPQGVFMLSLIKGGVTFRCDIDLSTGDATISIVGHADLFEPVTAKTSIKSKGNYKIMFCNIDEELRLIVNNKEIDFKMNNRYDKLCDQNTPLNRNRQPTKNDLKPVSIGAKNASVKVEHISVWRDMYYIACNEKNRSHCDLLDSPLNFVRNAYTIEEIERSLNRFFSDPQYWESLGQTRMVEFKLEQDQFLMLGDNSAKSKDSRLWTEDLIPHYVDRKMLIGEAMFVYWPHGLRIFGTRFAIIPNFKKIRRIY
ncbi:MAG: S26 family signal peptidase [Planctomycetaceae bacterium]|jgi:signal peptidase I|nr:S26 family signal peptidase [Planctomycetaceae bacterium]